MPPPDLFPNNMKELKAPRNRSIALTSDEQTFYQQQLVKLFSAVDPERIENKTINQDLWEILDFLPRNFVDLLFIDPPYNLNKTFNNTRFRERSCQAYADWLETWFPQLIGILKPAASVYICGDWRSSSAIQFVAEKYLKIRNRITWEREKGRGAKTNWKNCSEDIWFCTVSERHTFNLEAVKLKRQVIATYTDAAGKPKDWEKSRDINYRLTHPSNLWTDLTVPFWSMSENTEHPTQKPEKMLAKIILASSHPGDLVFDPFLGSGTTSVVAKKLGRRYVGIERERTYCCLAEKRLKMADTDRTIQGYNDGVFWERNSLAKQRAAAQKV